MSIDICKICKRLKIYTNITRFMLILKHLIFFIRAFVQVVFKDRLFLNLLVLLMFFLINISKIQEPTSSFIYGALFSILVTANLESSANLYKKEIIWDGDSAIIEYEKYNFEHKKGIYISLCGCLSDIIAMIVNYFGEPYREGRLTSIKHFNDAAERYRLWRLEAFQPNFNRIDELHSYNAFVHYVRVFRKIDVIILSMQNIQSHLNSYCPQLNVKCTMGLLLNELFISSSNIKDLQIFIEDSSPEDDNITWRIRLNELLEQRQINIDALNNNIRNLVIHLSLMYKDINNDYDFDKNEGE